ncbi:MAG TPA: hypothetical protein PLS69_13390, partial [Terricaulis sp.]|nr:hypothetical protein [Terricaulis sp.]
MAIDTPTRDYQAQAKAWAKIRALCEGVDGARQFVTPLPSTNATEYAEFAKRAYYMPALPRTVEMFSGLIFLRAPLIKAPDALKPYLDDVDLAGTSFDNIAAQVVSEVLRTNRVAVHVDHPPAPDGLSRLDAERRGLRAYARTYNTESIIGAEYSYVGGARKLWRVRLAETHIETDAEFNQAEVKRVRVLELREGVYTQTVWAQMPGGKWEVVEPTITPQRNGRPLDYLPIFFFSD